MDVFGKLNKFLTTDDSFKFDISSSYDDEDSIINEGKSEIKNQPSDPTIIGSDLMEFGSETSKNSEPLKLRRSKRHASTSQNNSQSITEDVCDLTDGWYDYPSKAKSRRVASDVPCEEIDLTNISPVETTKRGKKKAPRMISYKKAINILKTAIPTTIPPDNQPRNLRNSENVVDLTGDFIMTDIHNKNPLFQKVEVIKNKSKNYKQQKAKLSLDLSEDIDDTRINVKINNEIRKYILKSSQRFYDLFKMIAEDEDVPVCNVLCYKGNKRILPEDTPASAQHRVSFIYTCKFFDASSFEVNKKDKIELKFQSDKWKKPIALRVSRFEAFLSHIKELCKTIDFKPEQFSLEFDGDDIDMSKTPIELEFEGGEIIDCRVKA